MMGSDEELRATRSRASRAAKAILSGELGLIEGVRLLLPIVTRLPEYEDRLFLIIRSVESQTDDIPLGNERDKVAQGELEKMDREMAEFLPLVREDLMEACRQIVARYG